MRRLTLWLLLVWVLAGCQGKPAGTAPDFTLQSAQGPVSLENFRGKAVLLFFGYTSCPDVCPTSLGLTALALRQLSDAEIRQVQPIFISVDPERDTPQKLAAYVSHFHPAFIGLSGDPASIAKTAKAYGAVYVRQPPGPSGNYAIDHSAFTCLIDGNGNLIQSLPHGSPPEETLKALRAVLRQLPSRP